MKYIIVRASEKVYDHNRSLNERGYIYWYYKNKMNINIGDRIIVLYAKPKRRIEYILEVCEILNDGNIEKIKNSDEKKYWNNHLEYERIISASKNIYRTELFYRYESVITNLDEFFKNYSDKKNNFNFQSIQSIKYLDDFTNYEFHKKIEKHQEGSRQNRFKENIEKNMDSILSVLIKEGKPKLVESVINERSAQINRLKKEYLIKSDNCQFCGNNSVFGKINTINAHHLIPISEYSKIDKEETSRDDVAFICSNCHTLIHKIVNEPRELGKLSINEQKKLVEKTLNNET